MKDLENIVLFLVILSALLYAFCSLAVFTSFCDKKDDSFWQCLVNEGLGPLG